MVRHWLSFLVIAAGVVIAAGTAFAQPPTTASLSGAYNVRYLGVNTNPADSAVSFSGTITFDGNGGFTVTGSGASVATSDHTLKFLTSGQYQVLSNGLILMTNPFDSTGTGKLSNCYNLDTCLSGGLSNGYFTASSTYTNYCDIFVAIKAGSGESNSTLNGTYRTASLEFQNGDFTAGTRDTFFSMTADGKGGLGNVSITGTAQSLNNADTTQTSSGATYTVTANGSGTLNLPAPSGLTAANTLLSGNKTMYVSQDGNIFVAGGATTYDLVFGVRAAPGASMSGIYFTSYLENNGGVTGAQGASTMLNANDELANNQINDEVYGFYSSTARDRFTFGADGVETDAGSYWALGGNGDIVVSAGRGSDYWLWIYGKSVPMGLSGNYLNPQGVTNAATSMPFTTLFAPGEFISLYGNGFTNNNNTVVSGLPFPTSLGGVTVTVKSADGSYTANAPIYFVSPTQINAIIPFNAPSDGSLLQISVSNVPNSAWVYSSLTDPGVYPSPTGEAGVGAMIHNSTGAIVTGANPAAAGEAIQIYCNGLGTVTPAVATGVGAPTTQVSNTDNAVAVYIDATTSAKVLFAGLAPGFAGLYQINVTIPSGLSSGNHTLEISTVDGDNYQAVIPIK